MFLRSHHNYTEQMPVGPGGSTGTGGHPGSNSRTNVHLVLYVLGVLFEELVPCGMASEPPMTWYHPDEDESISAAIVRALSNAKRRDITEEECVLSENVDPDAIDAMFREGGTDDTIKVEFTTHEAIVVLWGNGQLTAEVQDLEADPNYG